MEIVSPGCEGRHRRRLAVTRFLERVLGYVSGRNNRSSGAVEPLARSGVGPAQHDWANERHNSVGSAFERPGYMTPNQRADVMGTPQWRAARRQTPHASAGDHTVASAVGNPGWREYHANLAARTWPPEPPSAPQGQNEGYSSDIYRGALDGVVPSVVGMPPQK
jgi:hypothetical protein